MNAKFLLTLLCGMVNLHAFAQPPAPPVADGGYLIHDSVLIPSKDGAQISALVVRKEGVTTPQATILVFTIYARATDIRKAKEAADKGYVGMVAYTRGKRYSPGPVLPYEQDGADVHTVIGWIVRQSWSDGQVGMYGGSYNGFTQWAATKHLHPALKTIVPSAAVAPGLDVPMTNNVVMSFTFPWTYYVSNNKWLDEADYNDQRWNEAYQQWFATGLPYRSLDSIAGRPGNPIFQRWLDHPAYDTYWQNMIPYGEEFARIDIPVLTTTGYFDGGQIGATYYWREHLRYLPRAQHYFLIGPYGHFGAQGYPDTVYRGYPVDPIALVPIHDIIYQWFDHILKKGPRPALLKDRINYQVMGSNDWKHVPSPDRMSNDTLTFYLQPSSTGGRHRLSPQRPATRQSTRQVIDFADRQSRHSYYYANHIFYDSLPTYGGLVFVSTPLTAPFAITGSFWGRLSATINKQDMDYSVVLFEQLPDGRYCYLSYFMGRASYAHTPTRRQLLVSGQKTAIPFTNTYITCRQLQTGSRILAIVNINKSPFEQINYGTGKDVSTERLQDARQPLQIKWHNDSYLKIPVWR